MQKAQELLREETVSCVAEKLGFSSVYAFSRAFRLHYGYPPSKQIEMSGGIINEL